MLTFIKSKLNLPTKEQVLIGVIKSCIEDLRKDAQKKSDVAGKLLDLATDNHVETSRVIEHYQRMIEVARTDANEYTLEMQKKAQSLGIRATQEKSKASALASALEYFDE